MIEGKNILLPSPIIDAKEDASIKVLTDSYGKLVKPGVLAKTGKNEEIETIAENIEE